MTVLSYAPELGAAVQHLARALRARSVGASVLADDRRQRHLRTREPDSRTGHGQDHAGDLVGEHEAGLGMAFGRLRGQSDRPPVPRQQLLHHWPLQRHEFLGIGGVSPPSAAPRGSTLAKRIRLRSTTSSTPRSAESRSARCSIARHGWSATRKRPANRECGTKSEPRRWIR